MELLYVLQEIDGRLFFTLFRQGERRAVRQLAQATSRSADGYLILLTPAVLFLIGAQDLLLFVQLICCALAAERVLYWGLKNSLRRQRPQDSFPGFHSLITAADKFSFPSGHTSAAFLLVTALFLVYGGVATAMYIWATAVGLSRIVLGVHYPGDTIAGAIMGSAIALSLFSFLAGAA